MELFLLHLSAFLRPVFSIDVGSQHLFDAAGIALTAALGFALLVRATTSQPLRLGGIDFLGIAFAFWCVSAYLIYFGHSSLRELARLVIPVVTLTIAANVLRGRRDYRNMLRLMLAGLSIPIILSTVVIAAGGGKYSTQEHYFTGAIRWEGVYGGPHTLGHNAAFFLFAAAAYLCVGQSAERRLAAWEKWFLGTTAAAALFCVGMSQVRTVILGLMIFCGVFLYFANKRLLLVLAGAGAFGFVLAYPLVKPYLFPEIVMAERGHWDLSYIGSGRFYIWAASLNEFARLPLDQKIAGFGIGRLITIFGSEAQSHNDYLDLLLRTGLVGTLLYLCREFLIFRAILTLESDRLRHVLLGIFVAVFVMNVVSVSYIGRFALGQMYSMLLAYAMIEARGRIAAPATGRAGVYGPPARALRAGAQGRYPG